MAVEGFPGLQNPLLHPPQHLPGIPGHLPPEIGKPLSQIWEGALRQVCGQGALFSLVSGKLTARLDRATVL